MNEDLKQFIKSALTEKIPRPDIKKALSQAGWAEEEIVSAIGAFAEIDFPIPVPRQRPYLSAREAFIYLLLFACLYWSAWSFGTLLFDFINHWIPDKLSQYYQLDIFGVRTSIASLIVAFPIYFWLTTLTIRWISRDPEKKSSKVRKWLTYLTLFVAASIIIGDLITLIYNLLAGELTLRFILKVLAVMLIAGLIFGYYLWDLRKEEK
ncbi:MAG: DUF5671 domain-containing protein [Patescibacteria group bacterium]